MASSPPTTVPFNPRDLPVWQEATLQLQQQPPVAAERLQASALQRRFATELAWQPEPRNERIFPSASLRDAAVLIGLQPASPTNPALHVVLTQRGTHLASHPGQIAFPGGKIDTADADARATALREAQEEIRLLPEHVQILGQLPPFETGTDYRVIPVVALLHPAAAFCPNPHEVTDIFQVPLAFLMNPAHHRKHVWQPQNSHRREWFSMPYTGPDGQERFIWGVTAGILRDLYRFLSA